MNIITLISNTNNSTARELSSDTAIVKSFAKGTTVMFTHDSTNDLELILNGVTFNLALINGGTGARGDQYFFKVTDNNGLSIVNGVSGTNSAYTVYAVDVSVISQPGNKV